MITSGITNISDLYLGESQVQKVCLGPVQVWPEQQLTGIKIQALYYSTSTSLQLLYKNANYNELTGMVVNGVSLTPATGVTVPSGYTVVEYSFRSAETLTNMFSGVTKLVEFKCNDIERFGAYTFYRCTGLTGNLVIDNNVKYVGSYAFEHTKYTNLVLGTGLTNIDESAFADIPITTLTVPGNIKAIGSQAFAICTGLTSLILEEGIEVIQWNAFAGCDNIPGSLTIPSTVRWAGEHIFTSPLITSLYLAGPVQLGYHAFRLSNLEELHITSPEWPTFYNSYGPSDAFENVPATGTMYVNSAITGTAWTIPGWTVEYI